MTISQDALMRNGYPRKLVCQFLSPSEGVAEEVYGQPKATVCLPHVCGVPEALKRGLELSGIRLVIRPHQTLRKRLVYLKDVIPKMERSCVVYCIPCGGCPAKYVRETKRKLGKRVNEHKSVNGGQILRYRL